jgi:hypothetical protein
MAVKMVLAPTVTGLLEDVRVVVVAAGDTNMTVTPSLPERSGVVLVKVAKMSGATSTPELKSMESQSASPRPLMATL